MCSDKISKLEKEIIDRCHESSTLFCDVIQELIQKLLVVFEFNILIFRAMADRNCGVAENRFFYFMSDLVNGLDQCIKWAYSLCKSADDFSIFFPIDEDDIDKLTKLMFEGVNYADLVDHFVPYHRNELGGELINDSTIRFYHLNDDELIYAAYKSDLCDRTTAKRAYDFVKCIPYEEAKRSIDIIKKSKAETIDDDVTFVDFSHDITGDSFKPFIRQAKIWNKTNNHFPKEWKFDNFSYIECEKFLIAFAAILLHFYATSIDYDSLPIISTKSNPVYIFNKDILIKHVSKIYPDFCSESITNILRLITYDSTIKNNSIHMQPVIQLLEDLFITSPHLFFSMDFTRSLSFHLGRTNDKKFQICITEMEAVQTKIIFDAARKFNNLEFKAHIKLPKPNPDIDLAIIDSANKSVIFIELKWFCGIPNSSKWYNCYNELNYKKEQCDKINSYIMAANDNEISRLLQSQIEKDLTSFLNIVLVEGFPDVPSQSYQILSLNTIIKIIENHFGNIKHVINSIESKSYLAKDYAKSMLSHRIIKYAGFIIEVPSFIEYCKIGQNDPCPCGKRNQNGTRMKYKHCCSSKYE